MKQKLAVAVANSSAAIKLWAASEVYDHSASSFVYRFIGDVNLFSERTEVLDEPGPPMPGTREVSYVRPHELTISRHIDPVPGALIAAVRSISSAGAVVRLELERGDNGALMDAQIPRDKYHELHLSIGDLVDVTPRSLKVFAQEG